MVFFEGNVSLAMADDSCGCLRDCEGINVGTMVDRVRLDPIVECTDEALMRLTFHGINTAADYAGWVFKRSKLCVAVKNMLLHILSQE